MSIKMAWSVAGAFAVAVGVSACTDFTGVSLEDLAGTWTATSAVVTNPAMQSQTEDLVDLGFDLQFIIDVSGRTEVLFVLGELVERSIGTMSVDESTGEFAIVTDGRLSTGTVLRQGDVMAVDIRTGVEWAFDDGFDIPVTLFVTLLRDRVTST